MSAGMGFAEILLIVLTGGGLGPMLGLPAGPRDEALIRCPPANTMVYSEWAQRGAGRLDGPGLEGLIADHEMQEFLEKLETAIIDTVAQETQNAPPEVQAAAETAPRLIREFLNQPGCFYLSYQEDNVLTGDSPPAIMMSLLHGVRFALIIDGGKRADAIEKDLLTLTQLLPEQARKESLDRLALPLPLPGVPVLVHRHKQHFILSLGDGVLDGVIAGLDGDSHGFGENERFQAGMKKVQFEKTGSFSWADVAQFRTLAQTALEPVGVDVQGMAAMVGLDSLDYIVSATGLEKGQITNRQFIATDGKLNGILKLAAGRAITKEDFNYVPADADFLFALSFNAEEILEEVRKIVGTAGEGPARAVEDALREFQDETGLSVENDIIPSIGDVWTIHNSPESGGILFSGLILSVEVRDHKQALVTYHEVMRLIEENTPGIRVEGRRSRGVELKSQAFMGRTIHYFHTVGEDDFPLAPAFCLTKERLYIALHPQSIKAQLRFTKGKFQRFASRLEGPLKLPEGDLLCLTYWDAQATAKLLYAIVPYVSQVILTEVQQNTQVELDIFDIPSARGLLPYIGPHSSMVERRKDGIYSTTISGLPVPMGSGMGTLFPVLMGIGRFGKAQVHFENVAEPIAVPAAD